MLFSSIAIASTLIVGLVLFNKRVRLSQQWRATVTPLASIIGSGFLIVAPLLHSVMGKWALLGMFVLSIFAFALGGIIRYNIVNAEPYLDQNPQGSIAKIEQVGQWFLGGAYAISVAFYISLFSAFVFDRIGVSDITTIKLVTTALLVAIMAIAWLRGAKGLELIELYAVTIKLAIIVGVLIALLTYDISVGTAWFQHSAIKELSQLETISMLAGMLMVTQGFETTRFMGGQYSAVQRVKAVKYSQCIAITLYLIFIGLTCPIFLEYPIVELNETTISHTLGQAVWVLPFLLLIAATASQLSAALADTIGGGGLLRELVRIRLSTNVYYMLIVILAIALVWSANVFEIINYASKGFALYYLVQTIVTVLLLLKEPDKTSLTWLKTVGSVLIAGTLVLVIGWSTPAPHS
jgi:hypothetical protein